MPITEIDFNIQGKLHYKKHQKCMPYVINYVKLDLFSKINTISALLY